MDFFLGPRMAIYDMYGTLVDGTCSFQVLSKVIIDIDSFKVKRTSAMHETSSPAA